MEAMTLTEITVVPQIFGDFFFFNGKENSKTKNILFICNYGNTNTRKTQEDCKIGTWEAFYLVVLGKGQSWDGIYVLGH